MNNYLAENGLRIKIIKQIFVNNIIHFLGLSDQAWGSGLQFISNLLAHIEATGWRRSNNPNQNWRGRFNGTNIIMNVSWGASIDPCPDYLTQSPVNPRAAQRHVHDDLLCHRGQERLWRQYIWRNPSVNPQVHLRGQDRNGPVTQ